MTLHSVKHLMIQLLRRGIQISVILLLAGLVYLSLYGHYRAAHALEDLEGSRRTVLHSLDKMVNKLDDPQQFLDETYGTVWSMKVVGWEWTDPLALVEPVAASKTIYLPLLISVLTPLLLTLILGKVFCSWMCPAYLLFEVSGKLRRLLRFAEIPPARVSFSYKNKYVFLALGLLFALIIGLPFFVLIYPPAVMNRLIHAWIYGTALAGMAIVLGLIIGFELLVSPRWWCRTMCPGGALYGLIGWPRLLRVRLDRQRCTACGVCGPMCQMGLDPVKEPDGVECDNCGVCVRRCPERALKYTLSLPGRRRKSRTEDSVIVNEQEIHQKSKESGIHA